MVASLFVCLASIPSCWLNVKIIHVRLSIGRGQIHQGVNMHKNIMGI